MNTSIGKNSGKREGSHVYEMDDKTSNTIGNLLQTNPGLAVVAFVIWEASKGLNRVADALYQIAQTYTGSGL